jgi:hypothetical protein
MSLTNTSREEAEKIVDNEIAAGHLNITGDDQESQQSASESQDGSGSNEDGSGSRNQETEQQGSGQTEQQGSGQPEQQGSEQPEQQESGEKPAEQEQTDDEPKGALVESGDEQDARINSDEAAGSEQQEDKKEYPEYQGQKSLRRQEQDDYYEGTYTDEDGNQKKVIIKRDKDGNETVYDYYGDGKVLTGGTYEKGKQLNGLTSADRSDAKYDPNAENNYVDVALRDVTTPSGEVIKAGEELMSGKHITQTEGAGERGSGYAPGQQKELATNGSFQTVVSANQSENVFKNQSASDGKTSYSKNEYIAAYASSGQYSATDLSLTANALPEEMFASNSSTFFYGTEFEEMLPDLQGIDWQAKADGYRSTVNELKEQFNSLHDSIEGWTGSASASDKKTLENILMKFEVTMANIEDNLEPACEAMMDFVKELETLQELEKTYVSYHGKMELPNGATSQCKDVVFDARSVDVIQKEYDEKIANEPALTIPQESMEEYTENGVTSTRPVTVDVPNPAHATWETEKAALETELNNAKEQDAKNLKALEDQLLIVIAAYYQIKNFETTVQSYKAYFTEGTDQYKWLHGDGTSFDMQSIISSHDYIIDDFEDYSRMPVITNLSDYEIGDIIAFDDAHGYVYAVTGAFDPLTGTIKIACFDKDGNQVGSEVSIWDQREIVPIQYVQEYDDFYQDYIETTGGGPSVVTTTASPTPDTPPPPPPPPPETTVPTPETTVPTPETTVPTPETTVPIPETTIPQPETTVPIEETIPSIPVQTIPYTSVIYTGVYEEEEHSPHTGLNAIYGTGDTKQSATGLGALAGLAAGAAGLGLTGLIGDKKDKEDEEEDEEEPETKHKIEEKEPANADDSSSNPTFF